MKKTQLRRTGMMIAFGGDGMTVITVRLSDTQLSGFGSQLWLRRF